jgi:hypothetical protein
MRLTELGMRTIKSIDGTPGDQKQTCDDSYQSDDLLLEIDNQAAQIRFDHVTCKSCEEYCPVSIWEINATFRTEYIQNRYSSAEKALLFNYNMLIVLLGWAVEGYVSWFYRPVMWRGENNSFQDKMTKYINLRTVIDEGLFRTTTATSHAKSTWLRKGKYIGIKVRPNRVNRPNIKKREYYLTLNKP